MNKPPLHLKRAANCIAYALGEQRRHGYHVRRIVWGLTMAKAERRPEESIRRAVLFVETCPKKPKTKKAGSP